MSEKKCKEGKKGKIRRSRERWGKEKKIKRLRVKEKR